MNEKLFIKSRAHGNGVKAAYTSHWDMDILSYDEMIRTHRRNRVDAAVKTYIRYLALTALAAMAAAVLYTGII